MVLAYLRWATEARPGNTLRPSSFVRRTLCYRARRLACLNETADHSLPLVPAVFGLPVSVKHTNEIIHSREVNSCRIKCSSTGPCLGMYRRSSKPSRIPDSKSSRIRPVHGSLFHSVISRLLYSTLLFFGFASIYSAITERQWPRRCRIPSSSLMVNVIIHGRWRCFSLRFALSSHGLLINSA